MSKKKKVTNAEQPTEQPNAGGDGAVEGTAPAPAGEGESGGAGPGGAGGESQPEPEATEGSGQEVPESSGAEEGAPAEAAAPEVTTELGNGPEQPAAGLPSEDGSKPSETTGSGDDKSALEKLTEVGNEAIDGAKETGRKLVKDALVESRDYITTLLKSKNLSKEQSAELKRLYIAGEKHALNGKVAVAHSMAKRINNYINTHKVVVTSEKARATDNYLGSLWKLVSGAVGTFASAFGGPLVNKLADVGLTAVDEFLQ